MDLDQNEVLELKGLGKNAPAVLILHKGQSGKEPVSYGQELTSDSLRKWLY